nr:unnamed protein product [Callosobruchus analis]
MLQPGVVKIADEQDFDALRSLMDDHTNWRLEYDKKAHPHPQPHPATSSSSSTNMRIWTKPTNACSFRMVKVHAFFPHVRPSTVFDVLHDPGYRKMWDEHMIESIDIGYLDPTNDVSYYALSCPPFIKNRDFVLQRSWSNKKDEKLILNHSVHHKDYDFRKGYVRATSYITGYVIRRMKDGCFIGYISQSDPGGKVPPWLVNRIAHIVAPKIVENVRKAVDGYAEWKKAQPDATFKPWLHPEQALLSPQVSIHDCSAADADVAVEDRHHQLPRPHLPPDIYARSH